MKKTGEKKQYRLSFSFEGKQYSVRSTDRRKLNAMREKKLAALRNGVKSLDSSVTVKKWGEEWRTTYVTGTQSGAAKRAESMLRNHIYPDLGATRLSAVRNINCQRVLNAMQDKGYARDTILKVSQLLERVFRDAVRNGLILRSPAEGLVIPSTREPDTHRCITARERRILLEAIQGDPIELFVLIMLYCGLRPSEIFPLSGKDVSLGEHPEIRVTKAADSKGRIKPPKSKAGVRTVPIPEGPLLDKLRETPPGPFEFVFHRKDGKAHTRQTLKTLWRNLRGKMDDLDAALVAAGKLSGLRDAVPPMVPYDLRHTYCSDLEAAGVPINVARVLMGHSKMELTARIYTHTADDTIREAAQRLSAYSAKKPASKSDIGDVKSDIPVRPKVPQSAPIRHKKPRIVKIKNHNQTTA